MDPPGYMRHLEIFHCLPSLSLPYKYSSNRSDQSGGPSRLRAAAVSRSDSVFSAGGSDASIVIRTFVFGSRSSGSSGRSTSPSKVAVMVLVISLLLTTHRRYRRSLANYLNNQLDHTRIVREILRRHLNRVTPRRQPRWYSQVPDVRLSFRVPHHRLWQRSKDASRDHPSVAVRTN